MNTHRTKLVHCHPITYVYNYVSPKNITAFTFEDEAVHLQRSILSNFAADYVGSSFTLNINNVEEVPAIQARLDYFLSKIARRGIRYIAVLDLNPTQPCVHLLTNRINKRTNEQLTSLWGNTVTKDYIYFDELLVRYTTAVHNTSVLATPSIFTSEQLKKPCILHNDAADDFLYTHEEISTSEFKVYEILDEQYGVITVTEYEPFFFNIYRMISC